MRRASWGVRLLLLGMAAACTDAQPVAPGTRGTRSDGAVLTWLPMGRFTVGTDAPTGELNLQSTGIIIPAGVTARVWVRGGLTVSYNNAYDAFCTTGSVDGARDCGGLTYGGVTAGPLGLSDGSLYTSVYLDAPEGLRRIMMGVPSNGDGVTVDADVTGPGTLYVSRSGTGTYWSGVPAYFASGVQEVEADTLGYVAPGDTGRSCPSAVGRQIGPRPDCATGDLPPELQLRCTPAMVTRGQPSVCTATTEPTARSFEVIGWQFRGGGFTIMPGMRNPANAAVQNRSKTWGGEMTVSGDVTVSAMVNGEAKTATAHIEVNARDWPQDPYPDTTIVVQSCVQVDSLCILRRPPVYYMDLARTRIPPRSDAWHVHAPGSGPNEGLWYLLGDRSPLHIGPITIWRNGLFDDPHDPYWRTKTNCTPQALWATVIVHEGTHIRFSREFWDSEQATKMLEALVFQAPESDVTSRVEGAFSAALRWILDAADREHYRYQDYPPFTCETGLLHNPK